MMNENKFTPRAEEALRLSQESAEELGHGYVGSELKYLKRHGFAAFGVYRILVGGVILVLMGMGVELALV